METRPLTSPRTQSRRRVTAVVCAVTAIGGLVVTILGWQAMDLATVGVGLLMVFVSVASSRAFRAIARTNSLLRQTNKQLKGLATELSSAEAPLSQPLHSGVDDADASLIELISLGQHDPRSLAAATLDGSTFPRLATLVNEAAVESQADVPGEADDDSVEASQPSAQPAEGREALERRLRREFSERALRRDYAGLLDVGRRICALLPDRPIAVEFERLEPLLIRKAESVNANRGAYGPRPTPSAIVFDHPRRANG